MKNNLPEKFIYVVGFPKSGTTWLIRLLADCLRFRVGSNLKGKEKDQFASSVNLQIDLPGSTEYNLWKTHSMPLNLMQEMNQSINRAVYIYRDFRDIVVSSFFYMHGKEYETEVLKSLRTSRFKEIYWTLRDFVMRKKRCSEKDVDTLADYMKRSRTRNPPRLLFEHTVSISKGWSNEVPSWSTHINTWNDFKSINVESIIVFVSYEKLLSNTEETLKEIIDALHFPLPSEEYLKATVERQSFREQKKYIEEMSSPNLLPLEREFNLTFLRKGVAGDWVHYFTKEMGKVVEEYHGEMLKNMGYNRDRRWYEVL